MCERHTSWTEICGCGPVWLSGRLRRGKSLPENGCWRRPRRRSGVTLCSTRLVTGVPGPRCQATLLDRNLNVEPSVIRDKDEEDDSEAAFARSLHLFRAEEKTFGWHCARVVIWHQPRQKRKRTRAVAGDQRRMSWATRLPVRSSVVSKSRKQKSEVNGVTKSGSSVAGHARSFSQMCILFALPAGIWLCASVHFQSHTIRTHVRLIVARFASFSGCLTLSSGSNVSCCRKVVKKRSPKIASKHVVTRHDQKQAHEFYANK